MNDFYASFRRIINSGQSRSVILSGNVHDLFFQDQYVPLIDFLCRKTKSPQLLQVVCELNGPIRIENEQLLREAYIAWKGGCNTPDDVVRMQKSTRKVGIAQQTKTEYQILAEEFDGLLTESQSNATLALQFLRHLTMCSRAKLRSVDGKKVNLLVIIEAADFLLPSGKDDISSLSDVDRKRISIVQDWFCDPAFCASGDAVCLIAESRSLIHSRVSKLPQVLSVEIPSPNSEDRESYIRWFCKQERINQEDWKVPKLTDAYWDVPEFARLTAGLSIQAIRQLLMGSRYSENQEAITPKLLISKIEEYIQGQVGEDVIEFKKPQHTLENVVGFSKLKEFLKKELIPRLQASGDKALPGAAVSGPIGSGKSYIFEAVAAELGLPVLVIKNIRSQWYGQTDVIFERLRRVLEALEKALIFVDEADTQFGGVGADTHETERRLTGKIQAMMSDPKLRGKIAWLLMTARINLLSPDIRRPGRVGDLIIPVLDPETDEDRKEFARWILGAASHIEPNDKNIAIILDLTKEYSAAAYASLRSEILAHETSQHPQTIEDVKDLLEDLIPPAITATRQYQKLQALVNCTRKSLLPEVSDIKESRKQWEEQIRIFELNGIK